MQYINVAIVDPKLANACEKFKAAFGYKNWQLTNEIADKEGHYDESPMHADYSVNGITIYLSELELVRKYFSDDPFFKKCLGTLKNFRGRFKSGATARLNGFHDPSYGNLRRDPDFNKLYG